MPAVNEADPRVRRTRKLLLDALVDLLAEKSFDAITVQDIADRSTINRATFYSHFADKYALFSCFSRDWFHRALSACLPEGVPLNRTTLRRLILATMEAVAEIDDHCRPTEALKPLVMSAVREELARFLLDWLQRASPPGEGTPEIALETTAAGLSWTIFGTTVDWSRMPQRTPADATATQIAALLTGGLSAVIGDVEP
jgi:AcrR family transcriptional regulator